MDIDCVLLNCIHCDKELDSEKEDDFYDEITNAWYCESCYECLMEAREEDDF